MDQRVLLGRRIKEIRNARGLSQEALAERMGINSKYLSSIERGRENPTFDLLETLARSLRVDLVDLFNYTWLRLSEKELRGRVQTLADSASAEELRDILALVRMRSF